MNRNESFCTGGTENIAVAASFVFVLIIGFWLISGIFISNNTAIKTAEAHGYSNVQVMEKNIFFLGFRNCGKLSSARFVISAKNQSGEYVRAFVCASYITNDHLVLE